MKLSRTAAQTAIAGHVAAATAAPAHAQPREWLPIEGHDQMVLATCSDGSKVLSTIPADPRRNRYSMDYRFDAEGNPIGVVLLL